MAETKTNGKLSQKDLIEAIEGLSESYENLSKAFIRFSVAYNNVAQYIYELKADNPTLFDKD